MNVVSDESTLSINHSDVSLVILY